MAWARDTPSLHQQTSAGDPWNFNHTIGGGSDRLLVVGVMWESGSVTVSGVTYNGSALSSAAAQADQGGNRAQIWYLLNTSLPAAGTYQVSVNMSGAIDGYAVASTYSGIAQSAPVATGSDIDTTTTTSVTLSPTISGGLGIDACDTNGGDFTPGDGQFSLGEGTGASSGHEGCVSDKSLAASSDSMTQTVASTNRQAHVAAAWDAAAPPAPKFILTRPA